MIQFNLRYFLLAALLFITEVLIALYVHDDFIRPYFGDFLVVVLIYCFVKSFLDIPVLKTAIFVLLFSFAVEASQYLNLVGILGLEHSRLAKTVLGNSFSWSDILSYIAGILVAIFIENAVRKRIPGIKKSQ
ncbi:ribosomal maturation YjgA family protein [Flavobacterium noncentrifugens]|uniref:DUF2809 domain-containing protein n=1 Tax=Flavobacterium noncentrifugens TaxID=1128970 RepID=A0A1G8YBC8_9FLAO|nr:DUF2809 domain-containing protein [Flavobacterium noncentrifugens]SDJ99996.1 Protein of unknown function [Flavobacterium noncentrifugens]